MNKTIENFYTNLYIDNISVIEYIAIDIGIAESEFIEIIEQAKEAQIDIIKERLCQLYMDKKNIYNSYQVLNAIDNIRELRRKPSLMGLTRDEMKLRFDKVLPPLRKSKYC